MITTEGAKVILKAAQRTQAATEALFSILEGASMTEADMLTVVNEFCEARDNLDSAVRSRGVLGLEPRPDWPVGAPQD